MAESPQSYDPRRFQSAVPYYARYRLGYPQSLIAKVIELVGLKHGDAVLDLGCGPGTLAIPFAKAGMRVTAVDPEPEMLAACEAAADAAGVALGVKQGSSFDMPQGIGPFRLVTMGRSFHWMDREATLAMLDALVTQDGAVVHFDDEHPRTVENTWRRVLTDLGDTYGRAGAPHIVERRSPEYRTHESYFLYSPFRRIERYGVVVQREITADDVVGLAYSLSYTAPQKLGDRKDEFERELRAALAELSPEGRFTEIADMGAMIGHRNR
ncbi:MAG TPA: methyltransferase domain-containing protein [Rhizomicrobium sp.]|jgi:2-polyprenyl-3-methyl-5-hydroxy-6-metoxy-1,4-benzoquinol methylase